LWAGSVWHLPVVPEAQRDALARRQAQAAATLARLGETEPLWRSLEHRPDPRLRSFLIHRLAPLGMDVHRLLARLASEREVSRRRALVLAIGEYPLDRLTTDERTEWLSRLWNWFREEPDPGLHGATGWLLRRWAGANAVARAEQDLARREVDRKPDPAAAPNRWYVNGQGQTMVVVPGPLVSWMGSPAHETERAAVPCSSLQRVRIPRSFALGATEVTRAQFRKFLGIPIDEQVTPDGPCLTITWYAAAAYCNWLSAQEGIPEGQWCYVANASGKYDDGMRMAPDYLIRSGYRLPTDAEWEIACRAGSTTRRFYGETDELLGQYAWYLNTTGGTKAMPVGLLKPNDLGLFDLYGNAAEWTANVKEPPLTETRDRRGMPLRLDGEQLAVLRSELSIFIRGLSYQKGAESLRSAARMTATSPRAGSRSLGFRVARSVPGLEAAESADPGPPPR
jgi:formylglycine-generating enzyme required for sulfatase activity